LELANSTLFVEDFAPIFPKIPPFSSLNFFAFTCGFVSIRIFSPVTGSTFAQDIKNMLKNRLKKVIYFIKISYFNRFIIISIF
jgi:hypothetical protein